MNWLPIETAPQDGTEILVSGAEGLSIARWDEKTHGPGSSGYVQRPGWVGRCNGYDIPDEGWDTGNGYTLELNAENAPLYWMPLPPPPNGDFSRPSERSE